MTELHTACEPLLKLATPLLYRHNLFRVLGVFVDAAPKDVQREQNRRKMRERLGIAGTDGRNGPLAVTPPPTDDDVRAATEALNRPVDRLLHEVFWFCPSHGDAASDPALNALQQGKLEGAVAIWKKQAKSNGQGTIATHNLAVFDHMIALDYEARLASEGLNRKQMKSLLALWKRVFSRWQKVLESEEYWTVLRNRVRNIDDATLTTGFVRRIRETLPIAILLINARIALGAAEQSEVALAQRHVQLVRESNLGDGFADEAIREALKPARNRIKAGTDNARSQWTSTPHHGNRYVQELYEQAKSVLATVDAILPADDLTRAALHDSVADAMLEGQIAFGKKTNDWEESIRLLTLAQELASGETVRSRLVENIEILQNNAKSGNDWCAPGYWDLPQETITALEDARAKTRSGDHQGAIEVLLVMDPAIGQPLRRCVAFCLGERGWQIAGEGLDEFNSEPPRNLKRFLDVIQRRGSVPVPSPYMEPWQVPACPCCGRSGYTRWVNGEYNGQPFWMCSSCAASDDREREQKKRRLGTKISEGLEYLLLAAEVDRHDPGVRDSVKSLKKIASDVEARVPGTSALKQRLATQRTRGVRCTLVPTQADQVCCFCGENGADDSCRITVPMCGDARPVPLLLHTGVEYRYADVVVPRCRRCRDEQRELPGRIEKWHEARLAAADNEHFPKIMQEFRATAKAVREILAVVTQRKKGVADAQAAAKEAAAIGERCDRCHAKSHWTRCLCRKCDSEVFRLSGSSRFGIGAAVALGLFTIFVLGYFVVGAALLLIGLVLAGVLKREQWERRRELREQRQREIPQRRKAAMEQAKTRLDQATSALKSAQQAAQKPMKLHEDAKKKLKAAKDRAVAAFERVHPKPRLTLGVKPESAYLTFGRLNDLRTSGWGFGHEWREGGQTGREHPINVTGLVAREPCPVTERVLVGCPKCGRRYRVSKKPNVVRIKCPCGQPFDCVDGVVRQPSASASSSSRPAKKRDRILEMARQSRAEELIRCPICGSGVKAKNLVRHYDRNHRGADVPDPPPSTARQAQGQSASKPQSTTGPYQGLVTCANCGKKYARQNQCPFCGRPPD